MADHRQQVEQYIKNELPDRFGSGTISDMYADLQKDMAFIRAKSPGMDKKKMEMLLHQKHRKLAFSYPGLFFRIVRGEVNPEMLKSLLKLKESLDGNDIGLDDARNRVIDCAKKQIEETSGKPRTKKTKAPGTVVQELSFKCKPDDS